MSSSSCTFDSPDADVILRAPLQSGVDDLFKDFRVHKLILSIASTVFQNTFSIPQPPRHTSGDTKLDVVRISESAEVVETFLQLIYPVDPPVITDLQLLDNVLRLADKYMAGCVITRLRKILVSPSFLKDDPIGVFIVACHNNLEVEEKVAVLHTFSIDVVRQISEEHVQAMTTKAYHRLLTKHAIRRGRLIDVFDSARDAAHSQYTRWSDPCPCYGGLKEQVLLEISGRPFLDREVLDKCLAKGGRRPPCSAESRCIQTPGKDAEFMSDVVRRIQAMAME